MVAVLLGKRLSSSKLLLNMWAEASTFYPCKSVLTCSEKIFAWSAQPMVRTWFATASIFHRKIRWRSLDTAAWLWWFMEFLSSVRNVDENPLPRGHGKQNGETCWMPLSATETSRQRKIENLNPILRSRRHISRCSAENGTFGLVPKVELVRALVETTLKYSIALFRRITPHPVMFTKMVD